MSNNKILILALLVATLLTGCAHKSDVERIGIISAMDNEISVLLEKAEIEQEDLVGGMKYYVGRLSGKNVVITRAGIGKVRASSGVTTMLNKYNISKVLFTIEYISVPLIKAFVVFDVADVFIILVLPFVVNILCE